MFETSSKSRVGESGKRKRHLLVIPTPYTLELVEDAIILIEITQFAAEMIVDWNSLDWLRLHVDVPDLER
jgi:hypothetical protein